MLTRLRPYGRRDVGKPMDIGSLAVTPWPRLTRTGREEEIEVACKSAESYAAGSCESHASDDDFE